MYFLGIDIGSLSCDAVLIDDDENVIASSVVPTGARNRESIARVSAEVLRDAGVDRGAVRATVSTGYGRDRVDDRLASVTEITCHARGIAKLVPGTRLLVDIGGQDSKAILMARDGRVVDFAMNDKCAAGTGRFLEAMARALQVDIDEMGPLAAGAEGRQTISSMCTVFAESEVVSLIADGTPVNEIVHGINRSIAARVAGMVKRIAPDHGALPAAMSGGVARNCGVVAALRGALGCEVAVPALPDTVGALGAALIARERCAAGAAAV
ncbi:MAG TPA: acyl-CoA dehydratase activase [Spirochaetota bacterium]|nr:acyl-CoA dehydratase activase [Spirochaetota bacterium]HOS39609.1 acyl-CoA dehydratase activase [Spirochaetota bacterium]HPI23202.1 acyl-CoA dehydratase activase [Spirochaetota bacterium]HPU89574.1 acyl-CoA dehydratase activase [Spirochaetota bacterium]